MVRECRPPARKPARSWLARRSTMATSTPANANSPANISPVGPPPVITTACSVIATLRPDTSRTTHAFRYSHFRRFSLRPALCGTTRGLTQAPRFAIYWKWKGVGTVLSTYRPLWTDNLLAKRRRAAYGGTVSPGGSLVGGELLRRQDCLEPQLSAGATLCWIVTLSIAQRGEYEDRGSRSRTGLRSICFWSRASSRASRIALPNILFASKVFSVAPKA